MHWQDVLKAICGLGLLWVLFEWCKALAAMMGQKLVGVEKRTMVVVHLLRASVISAAMCVAVWILAIGGAATHSSGVAATVFCCIVTALFGVYLAVIYGAAALRRRRS
ncbi:hypothetical protein [Burkholderia lata]|uniref:hypothetical protein n=1 Tax=Burkholderia lata (strain ATCC 17760 / DSM 23089 / LMG 22485 / NCIMB 9086 / R18194 / 383) TaxID=482957 RepID=UPI00158374F2|nr:hypothetical protein [Burkholderia lata]